MANLYPSTSPYYTTLMAPGNYLDIMSNVSIPKLPDDMYWVITVTYDTRPDMLAYDLYNDSKLWWVFASRNPNALPDPLFSFSAGKGIYLPKMSTLKQTLGL
jgi:hypothetical protein